MSLSCRCLHHHNPEHFQDCTRYWSILPCRCIGFHRYSLNSKCKGSLALPNEHSRPSDRIGRTCRHFHHHNSHPICIALWRNETPLSGEYFGFGNLAGGKVSRRISEPLISSFRAFLAPPAQAGQTKAPRPRREEIAKGILVFSSRFL